MRRAKKKNPKELIAKYTKPITSEKTSSSGLTTDKKNPPQEMIKKLRRRNLKRIIGEVGPNYIPTAESCLLMAGFFPKVRFTNCVVAVNLICEKLKKIEIRNKRKNNLS